MATAEQTPDETPSREVIDPPSTPAPEPTSDPSPASAPEPGPLPVQESTAPSAEIVAAPRHSAPRRRVPNHASPNHQRVRRPHHGRGSRPPFFPGANGRNFNLPPAPNWNPGFGFDPMWPSHQFMGVPLGVPLPSAPPLNYYDVNLPPVAIPLPHYGGSFYPDMNGPFYPFPLMPPGALPLGAGPVDPRAAPPPPPINLDQKVALLPTLSPLPPMNEDQKVVFPPTTPPPYMNEDRKATLLVELRKQIEYYFSDQNLVRDEYLKKQMDDEGWVAIQTVANFPKVVRQTTDLKVIEEALSSSDSVELQDSKLRKKYGWARYCIPKN